MKKLTLFFFSALLLLTGCRKSDDGITVIDDYTSLTEISYLSTLAVTPQPYEILKAQYGSRDGRAWFAEVDASGKVIYQWTAKEKIEHVYTDPADGVVKRINPAVIKPSIWKNSEGGYLLKYNNLFIFLEENAETRKVLSLNSYGFSLEITQGGYVIGGFPNYQYQLFSWAGGELTQPFLSDIYPDLWFGGTTPPRLWSSPDSFLRIDVESRSVNVSFCAHFVKGEEKVFTDTPYLESSDYMGSPTGVRVSRQIANSREWLVTINYTYTDGSKDQYHFLYPVNF